jgi:hypothetical protein
MKIKLLRNSALGRMGQVRDVDASSARGAILLGLAAKHVEPPPAVEPKPKRIYTRATEDPQPKRAYKRKDIVPAPDLAVEDPRPAPGLVVDDTDDDDAPVRLGD